MISKNTNNNLQFAILSPNDEAQISKGSEGFGSEWCKMLSNYSYTGTPLLRRFLIGRISN